MSILLYQPPVGSTSWGANVNANWQLIQDTLNSLVGGILAYIGSSAPTGWLFCDGLTIGNGSSGATSRANDDTQALFTLIWQSTSNAQFQLQDSSGSSVARGASATADFSSNHRIPLPDLRGRITAGKDSMGGQGAAGRISANAAMTIKAAIFEYTSSPDSNSRSIVSSWNGSAHNPSFSGPTQVGSTAVLNYSSGWQDIVVTGTPTVASNLIVIIWVDSGLGHGVTINLTKGGLYDGILTPTNTVRSWLPRPIQQELAMCQRYYCKSYPQGTSVPTNTSNGYQIGVASSTIAIRGFVPYPVEMRVTPTLVIYSNDGTSGSVTVLGGGATGTGAAGGDVSARMHSGLTISGVTANTTYFWQYSADAEL